MASDPVAWSALTVALAALGLYHRFRADRDLHHPIRSALLSAARERPGVLASTVAEETAFTLNAVLHHVRILVREGHLKVQRMGRAGLLFLGDAPPAEQNIRMALRPTVARSLLALVDPVAGAGIQQAAESLQVTDRSVRNHAARLERAGLLLWDRGTSGRALFLTARGRQLAASVSPPTSPSPTASGPTPSISAVE